MATPTPSPAPVSAPSPSSWNSTWGPSPEGGGNDYGESYFWILGCIAIALTGCAATSGVLMQKLAYVRYEATPPSKRCKCFGMPMNLMWWGGLIMMGVVPLPLNMIALGLASASLVAPIGTAVSLFVGQIIAPKCFRAEKLTLTDWLGTFVVLVGCVLTTAFGDRHSRRFTSDEILVLWGSPHFLAFFAGLTVILLVSLACIHAFRRCVNPVFHLACACYVPAYLGALQTISFKSMSVVTTNSAIGRGNEWHTWPPWVFLVGFIGPSIFQLRYMNYGAENFMATRYIPTSTTMSMVVIILMAAVFFEEYAHLHIVAFPTGVALIIVGIGVLARKDPTDLIVLERERDNNSSVTEHSAIDVAGTGADKNVVNEVASPAGPQMVEFLVATADSEGAPVTRGGATGAPRSSESGGENPVTTMRL